MTASDTQQNNVSFQILGTLTISGTSVKISDDIINGGACAFTDASILLQNISGTVIERVRGTASAGTLTLSKRWITLDKTLTENAALKKEWRAGSIGSVTVFASDMADIEGNVNISGDLTVTGNITTNDTTKPWFKPQSLTQTQINALPTTGTAIVYNSTSWEYNLLKWWSWYPVDLWTTTPFASPTVAWITEEATSAQSIAGTVLWETWADLFVTPLDIAKNTQSGTFVYADSSDVSDTYTVNLTPALTTYTTGMKVRVKFTTANTGACTINLNSLGAKSIKTRWGNDPQDWDIAGIRELTYDGTNFVLTLNKATTDEQWLAESATESEMAAGSDTFRYVTVSQWTDFYGYSITAWTTYISAQANTERTTTSATYVKLKEIQIKRSWNYTVSFDLDSNSNTVFARIYKNGVAFGTEQSKSWVGYVTKTEDLTFSAGDLLQLYANKWTATTAYVKNLNVKYALTKVTAWYNSTVVTD